MQQKPHILVVDDEPGPRESLKIILKPEFEVTTSARGSEALDLLRSGEFEAVLLDLTMPDDMSGTETLRSIRQAAIDVEAIVITGQGALDTAVECLRLGARDYIAKPYRAEDVTAAIRSALAVRTARRRASQMREHLLGNLSHEFRTPLNAIVGYSEILEEEAGDVLSDEQRQALARIQLNSERLLSYLEGLFFLAELDSGDMPMRPREFQVRPWLERVLQPIQREAMHSGLAIHLDCDDALVGYTHPETLAKLVSVLTYEATAGGGQSTISVSADRHEPGILEFAIEHDRLSFPMSDDAQAVKSDPELAETALASDKLAVEVVSRAARTLQAKIDSRATSERRVRVRVRVPEGGGAPAAAGNVLRSGRSHHSDTAAPAR